MLTFLLLSELLYALFSRPPCFVARGPLNVFLYAELYHWIFVLCWNYCAVL